MASYRLIQGMRRIVAMPPPPHGRNGIAPNRHQRNGFLLLAEGAGRRLASLTGFWGTSRSSELDPKISFYSFCTPPQAACEEKRKLGRSPKPQVKNGRP